MKNIVCFSSGGPGNFATVVDFCKNHIAEARIINLITDRAGIPAIQVAKDNAIDFRVFDFADKLDLKNQAGQEMRMLECQPILEHLISLEQKHGAIDLIVLAFRRVLVGEILQQYAGRIINMHPADLSVWDINSRTRRYVGIGGLKLSILDGNGETRTSIHQVDHGVDTGELLCLGPWVPVQMNQMNNANVEHHEQKQKIQSDRPALLAVLEKILINADNNVLVM